MSLNQLTIFGGMLVAYFVDWQLFDIGANNWRWMFVSETIPALALLGGMSLVPESPRWLTKQGKIEEAFSILSKIGGITHAQNEMNEIKTT